MARRRRDAPGASIIAMVLLTMAPLAFAQFGVEFSGPRMGYIYDAQIRRLRPVLGITGSARIGDALEIGLEMKDVLPIPGRDVAIGLSSDGSPALINLNAVPGEARKLEDVISNPSRVVLSPSGSSVALHYASAARVLILSGLPEKAQVAASLDLANIGGELNHLAVNDEGTFLVAALSSGGQDVLLGWNRSDPPRLLTTASQVSSVVFLGSDVVAADSGAGEVFALRNVENAASRVPLMRLGDGSSKIVVAAVTGMGSIYAADSGSGIIFALDVHGQLLGKYDCNCVISGFYPLNNTVFRLTERLDQPIIILDAGSPSARIAFIPAVPPALLSTQSGQDQ